MRWNTPDACNNPDHFGLTLLGDIEWDNYYSFNMTIVLRDSDGKLYWADDSGCSCTSAFEDYTHLDSLTTGTAEELDYHLDVRLADSAGKPSGEVADMKLKIRS